MSLPLLHLPLLAATEICKLMDIKERILLSFASKRAKRLVKCSVPKNHLEMRVTYTNRFEIVIGDSKVTAYYEPRNMRCETKMIGGVKLRIPATDDGDIQLLHNKPQTKPQLIIQRSLVEHFADAFNNPRVVLRMHNRLDSSLNYMKLMKDLELPVVSVDYMANSDSPEIITGVLEQCKAINKLHVSGIEDFQYSPGSPDEFKLDELRVSGNSQWVKLENFMGCKKIYLEFIAETQKTASPIYLNSFFKKMMATDCRLERLLLYFQHPLNIQKVVRGLGEIQQLKNGQFVEARGANGKGMRITVNCYDSHSELLFEVI